MKFKIISSVLICKSAGNCENFKQRAPKSEITKSADTVEVLLLVQLLLSQNLTEDSAKNNPSSFSRKGPGPSSIIKPDLTHFGGDAGLDNRNRLTINPIKSFSINGKVSKNVGTSFSTPRVTAIAAGLNFKLNEVFNPTLLKALIIHSAKYPERINRSF